MLKRLLFTLLCVYTTSLAEKLEWKNLDEEQIEVAKKVYEIAKESDLAETMIAISWQESRLGKIPINLSDKSSCGVQHVHIKTYMWMNNIKDTPLNRNLYCSNLIKDVELSTNAAIKYFLYAKKRHKGNHEKAIKSYNGGFDLKRVEKAVNEYYKNVKSYMSDAKEIINKIQEIQEVEKLNYDRSGFYLQVRMWETPYEQNTTQSINTNFEFNREPFWFNYPNKFRLSL